MWYKEKYRIVTENPYNKEKLNGLGLVIYSEWKDSFVNIIQKNEIKHLFLNYSLGWKCLLKTEDIHPPKTGISVHFSGSLV